MLHRAYWIIELINFASDEVIKSLSTSDNPDFGVQVLALWATKNNYSLEDKYKIIVSPKYIKCVQEDPNTKIPKVIAALESFNKKFTFDLHNGLSEIYFEDFCQAMTEIDSGFFRHLLSQLQTKKLKEGDITPAFVEKEYIEWLYVMKERYLAEFQYAKFIEELLDYFKNPKQE